MDLKFNLISRTDREDGTVSLKFIPEEGGATGDLTLDNVPAADAEAMSILPIPTSDERAGITHRDTFGTPVPPFAEKKAYQSFAVSIKAA